MTLYTPLPFWKLRADAGLSFSYDDYDNGNSLDSNGTARRDFEWSFSSGLTREINRNIAIRADYSYTDNDSNVQTSADEDPFSFDRWQFGLRLIITF